MICKFDYNKIDDMPITTLKIGKKATKEENVAKVSYEIDDAQSSG